MARRSDHSREDLKALALEAAREIVRDRGFRALTARAVTGRIGYAVGTLYNLFEDLDDLVIHLNALTLDHMYAAVSAGRGRGMLAPDAALTDLARAYIDYASRNRETWNVLFEHRPPPGHAVPDWYSARIDRLLALVEDALAPLFGGEITTECRATARILWSSVHGMCALALSGKLETVGGDQVSAMSGTLITTYLAGLRAKSGAGGV